MKSRIQQVQRWPHVLNVFCIKYTGHMAWMLLIFDLLKVVTWMLWIFNFSKVVAAVLECCESSISQKWWLHGLNVASQKWWPCGMKVVNLQFLKSGGLVALNLVNLRFLESGGQMSGMLWIFNFSKVVAAVLECCESSISQRWGPCGLNVFCKYIMT